MNNETALEWIETRYLQDEIHDENERFVLLSDAIEYGERCRAEGVGTCEFTLWGADPETGLFDCLECSCCNHILDVSEVKNYCPDCGRKVIKNDTTND